MEYLLIALDSKTNRAVAVTTAESEENMKKQIIIKDGTSKSQLNKAIKNYENCVRTTVLKFYVHEDHTYILIDFDGIIVSKWHGNVDDFINEVNASKMKLADIF